MLSAPVWPLQMEPAARPPLLAAPRRGATAVCRLVGLLTPLPVVPALRARDVGLLTPLLVVCSLVAGESRFLMPPWLLAGCKAGLAAWWLGLLAWAGAADGPVTPAAWLGSACSCCRGWSAGGGATHPGIACCTGTAVLAAEVPAGHNAHPSGGCKVKSEN